jgi:hypothetical protein
VTRRPWTGRPWTAAQRQRLLWLADTLPTSALAERFGRTRKAIQAQLWKLRGRRTPVAPVTVTDPRVRDAATARLAAEIKLARAEAGTTTPYRPGPLLW